MLECPRARVWFSETPIRSPTDSRVAQRAAVQASLGDGENDGEPPRNIAEEARNFVRLSPSRRACGSHAVGAQSETNRIVPPPTVGRISVASVVLITPSKVFSHSAPDAGS